MENYSGILWTVLVIIIAIISVSGNRNTPSARTQPPTTRNRTQNNPLPPPERIKEGHVPSLPSIEMPEARPTSIYDYPKCPICRSRNLRGEAQTVFAVGRGYRCVRDHTFT